MALLRFKHLSCSLFCHGHADNQTCCLNKHTSHSSFMLVGQSAAAVTCIFMRLRRLQQAAVNLHVWMQAHEKVGFYVVQLMRSTFDLFTGYKPTKQMSEERWLQRILFLETVAGEQCSASCSWRLLQATWGALLHAQCLTAGSCGQGTHSWKQQQVRAGSQAHRDWGEAPELTQTEACLCLRPSVSLCLHPSSG